MPGCYVTFHRNGDERARLNRPRGLLTTPDAETRSGRTFGQMRVSSMSGMSAAVANPLSPSERVTEVVRRLLADRAITRPFTAEEDLREIGLTSLDMVNLVLSVESELAVRIPESDITPTNFRSVASIEALVAGLRH